MNSILRRLSIRMIRDNDCRSPGLSALLCNGIQLQWKPFLQTDPDEGSFRDQPIYYIEMGSVYGASD